MRLTVETGPLAGTTLPLDRDQPAVLGSDESCSVRVREAGVQPQHAVVKALKDRGFGIKALAPGVRVNGAEVEASPLADGDVIEIGTTRIAFGERQREGLPQIAGYRILSVLGKGGMGMVYRAEQVSLRREVALKVLNRDLTSDPAFVARFVAEARAAAKLQHPNVVQVFDVEQDGGTYYYAMELMADGSLEQWLKQHGAMPVERALQVVADAARGLAYAESLGIVHRDIKPDNLMLDQHGAVKIADLGLASTAEAAEERAIGTPHFMAPEQVLKKELDHRTDLYALGCTFYRLVTGKTPFRGQTVKDILRAQVKDVAEPAHKVNADVPVEVSAVVQRLMAKEPSDRFQTANELLEQLELLMRPPVRRGLWIGLAVAAVLIAGGAVLWAVTRPKEKEIVQIEKVYDDPEKQQFADEIKQLKRERREDQARLALLTARLESGQGAELAAALDQVAAEHAGTAAADDALTLAQNVRRDVAERERRREQQREQVAAVLGELRRAQLAPLDRGDFAGALRQLERELPAELAGETELVDGITQLRTETLAKARRELESLVAAVDAARAGADEAALASANEALAAALQDKGRWPPAVGPVLATANDTLTAGREALTARQRARTDGAWSAYHDLLAQGTPLQRLTTTQDFATLAAATAAFANEASANVCAARARELAAAAERAELFAVQLAERLAAGGVPWPNDDEALQIVRWDRPAQQFFVVDPQKRGAKEVAKPATAVTLDGWRILAEQAGTAPAGSRECFLGLLGLAAHAEAARTFLGKLRRDDDASGTGGTAYPLGADLFDALLRRLPEQDPPLWAQGLRHELLAGQRLAAGLRALSERRNLAAASHLDRLLADHPHAAIVAVLP